MFINLVHLVVLYTDLFEKFLTELSRNIFHGKKNIYHFHFFGSVCNVNKVVIVL